MQVSSDYKIPLTFDNILIDGARLFLPYKTDHVLCLFYKTYLLIFNSKFNASFKV